MQSQQISNSLWATTRIGAISGLGNKSTAGLSSDFLYKVMDSKQVSPAILKRLEAQKTDSNKTAETEDVKKEDVKKPESKKEFTSIQDELLKRVPAPKSYSTTKVDVIA